MQDNAGKYTYSPGSESIPVIILNPSIVQHLSLLTSGSECFLNVEIFTILDK